MLKKLLHSATVVTLSAGPLMAAAQTSEALDRAKGVAGAGGLSTTRSLNETVGYIVQAVISLLGVVFVILLIYGGYNYMTAAGDDAKVAKAKKMMLNAVIGLVIVLMAYAIADYVIGALSNAAPI